MDNSITLVIPVHNRERLVERTLASIERQTARPLSVILVDNNSTDSTLDVLNRWAARVAAPDFKVSVISEPAPGAPAARNAGLRRVTTPFTMFFDSDDEMLPTHVADFQRAISLHPEVDIFGRSVLFKGTNGKTITRLFTTQSAWYNHIFHSILSTQRYVARTELFKRVGAWDASVMAWNDYELGVRVLLQNPVMMDLGGEPTVIVHETRQSITGTRFYEPTLAREHALDSCYNAIAPSGNTRLLNWIDTRRAILAAKYRLEGENVEANRLLNNLLAQSHAPMRLRLLYMQHLLCRRGTAIPARILF